MNFTEFVELRHDDNFNNKALAKKYALVLKALAEELENLADHLSENELKNNELLECIDNIILYNSDTITDYENQDGFGTEGMRL